MKFVDRLRRRHAARRAAKSAQGLPPDVSASLLIDGQLVPVAGDLSAVVRLGLERAAEERP